MILDNSLKAIYMGRTLLKWKQPRAMLRAWFRTQNSFDSYVWIIGVVFILSILYWVFISKHPALLVPVVCVAVPFLLDIKVPTYEFLEEGIKYESGRQRLKLNWDEIKSYSILQSDTGGIPGMVLFRLQKTEAWHSCPAFYYDPGKIDKSLLQSILQEYLPNKEFANVLDEELFSALST